MPFACLFAKVIFFPVHSIFDATRFSPQELKDKNDELTMEVEQMRQQLHSVRRRLLSGGASGQCTEGAGGQQLQRSGSVLSDYTVVEPRRPDSVSGIIIIHEAFVGR